MSASQSYCRHENTLEELQQVWEKWDEFDEAITQEREITARGRLLELIAEMAGELSLLDDFYE